MSEKFADGVNVKVVVEPCSTTALAGVTVPPVIAAIETVYFFNLKDAVTEHGAVIGPVVKVAPDSTPPQPATSAISYPSLGDTEIVVVRPAPTTVLGGDTVPPVPEEAVTV
jgi:hypothetical protein